MTTETTISTKEQLAQVLEEAGFPHMAKQARVGEYDDNESPHENPRQLLVDHCKAIQRPELARRAKSGEWRATRAERKAWQEREQIRIAELPPEPKAPEKSEPAPDPDEGLAMPRDEWEKTWKVFRDAGLLWFVNRLLHTFGWELVNQVDADTGRLLATYPQRTSDRGFGRESEERGFRRIAKYLKDTAPDLLSEICEAGEKGLEPVSASEGEGD